MAAKLKYLVGASTALILASCQTTADNTPSEAVLMESSPAATAALSEAVSSALGGRKVTLAPNVLLDSPKLVMDPKFVDDRSLERPDHFRLVKEGQDCYLVHEENLSKWSLPNVKCKAI